MALASFKSDIQSSKRQILVNQLFLKFNQVTSLDEFSDEERGLKYLGDKTSEKQNKLVYLESDTSNRDSTNLKEVDNSNMKQVEPSDVQLKF